MSKNYSYLDKTLSYKPRPMRSLFDEPEVIEFEFRAYCNSYMCCPDYTGALGKWIKNISRHAVFCPDCGAALFWQRVRK